MCKGISVAAGAAAGPGGIGRAGPRATRGHLAQQEQFWDTGPAEPSSPCRKRGSPGSWGHCHALVKLNQSQA